MGTDLRDILHGSSGLCTVSQAVRDRDGDGLGQGMTQRVDPAIVVVLLHRKPGRAGEGSVGRIVTVGSDGIIQREGIRL